MSNEDVAAAALFFSGLSVHRDNSMFDHLKRRRDEHTAMEEDENVKPSKKPFRRSKKKEPEYILPVEPRVVQIIKKNRIYVNHSYKDWSLVPPEIDNAGEPEDIDTMSFGQKLHHILSREEFSATICWMPHGRAFRILMPVWFERNVSGTYFGHTRYPAFLTLLNNYGFKHITQGTDRNCYYHEVRSCPRCHLTCYLSYSILITSNITHLLFFVQVVATRTASSLQVLT
jgi:hypothetical protein